MGAARYPNDTELKARLRSYELADRMQVAAPAAVDLSKESDATKELYGLNDETSASYGTTLLRARRLVERGVRFIQVVSGAPAARPKSPAGTRTATWKRTTRHDGRMIDKPIAGLLADLKRAACWNRRWWCGPRNSAAPPTARAAMAATTIHGATRNGWRAAALKAGFTYGATDEIGLQVADKDKAVDTYDLHATVLQLLGLDHLKTTFLNNGRSERPTVVYGKVIKELLV
jgi:hypothetical protein